MILKFYTLFPRLNFVLELYSPTSICSILTYEWSNDRPRIFAVNACVLYGSENSSIHCLKQSGNSAHSTSRISQLSAEMLAVSDDENDPFLLSEDDENEQGDYRRYADWLHLAAHFLAQTSYCAYIAKTCLHVCGRGLSSCIVQINCTRLVL